MTIKNNKFERLSDKYSVGSLFYIGHSMCNMNFNDNQIVLHNSVNTPIFNSYTKLDLTGFKIGHNTMYPLRKELIATENVPALMTDNIINQFEEGPVFEFKCPNEDDYDIILPNDEEGNDYESSKILACDKALTNPINAMNCILNIRYCTFKEFTSNAISIMNVDSSFSGEKTEICYCIFSNCKETSIDIETEDDSSSFDIVNCTFEFCSISTGASAINFNSANGKIEKCHFYYNQCIEGKGDITYIPSIVADKDKNKLTVTNNTFERSTKEFGKGSFFYYKYVMESKLDFNYNKLIVHIGLSMILFDCDTEYTSYNDWTFSDNCMQPYR